MQNRIPDYPFVYSFQQTTVVNTLDFPFVYDTPEGQILPQSFFNGSILNVNGRLIFCCRADQPPWFENIRLVICELDYDFVPKKETIKFLQVGSERGFYHVEDARLLLVDGKINIIYGDGFKIYHAVLRDDFTVEYWNNITNFGVNGLAEQDMREKNWAPFDYNGKLAVIYSDNPRVIYFPYTGKIYLPDQKNSWGYGQIRGGTPAIRWKNDYVTFFHSALNLDGKSWRGGRMYFMGAYIFESKPPFKVKAITKIPIYKASKEPQINPIAEMVDVVFPAGVAITPDSFYVSMGINDCCTTVLKVSKTLLENLLQPV